MQSFQVSWSVTMHLDLQNLNRIAPKKDLPDVNCSGLTTVTKRDTIKSLVCLEYLLLLKINDKTNPARCEICYLWMAALVVKPVQLTFPVNYKHIHADIFIPLRETIMLCMLKTPLHKRESLQRSVVLSNELRVWAPPRQPSIRTHKANHAGMKTDMIWDMWSWISEKIFER